MQEASKIALFEGKKIRKTFVGGEWWFVIEDIVLALIDSNDPKQYIQKMKQRDPELEQGWVQLVRTLEIKTAGGRQKMICGNTQSIFRIIQSIPSPKAEPFKQWLAKVGYERVQEIENPELGMQRVRELYRQKGYAEDWIEQRLRSISVRADLTDEWDARGAATKHDYAILTAEISKAAFGVTPSEYKKTKGLKRENLRDHMNNFELIFTALAEHSTAEIHRTENSRGVPKLKQDAQSGGDIAGGARQQLEKRLGKSIMTKKNFRGLKGGRKK